MKAKLFFSILSVILVIIAALLVTFATADIQTSSSPKATQGLLDLREYDWANHESLKLDGEWEFVLGRLVDSNYFRNPGYQPTYVHVPSLWSNYQLDDQAVPLYTSATYRLLIKTDTLNQLMGLKTSNIRMSNSIYVNGQLIGQSGIPKENTSYIQQNTPYISFFQVTEDILELIIHVANFDYASGGGIVNSIYFGEAQSIQVLREKALAYDLLMIASLLMIGLYFLGFYLNLRKDVHLLFFALFCFALALYFATHGEKILYLIYAELPYVLFQRLQLLAADGIGLSLLLYFHFSLKIFSHRKMTRILTLAGFGLLLTILFPVKINSQLTILYSTYLLTVFIYISAIQVKAIISRTTGAIYLIIGTITIIFYFIPETLNVLGIITINNLLPPLFPFIYLLMLSLYMAHRFADTYRKNKELSALLIRADQFKDEFLAKTSHEFRTPLYGIIAILQTMLDRSNTAILTTEQTNKVKHVIEIAKRLSSLVQDILDLAKLKRGELKIEIEDVDLFSNTHLVTELFTYILPEGISIHNKVPKDLPFVQADENRLRQILYNLIGNALKYTNSGAIEILAVERRDTIIISIKDTGCGIEPDKLKQIFEPYQRVDSKQEIEGVGLGLSIVKQLVELQGGEIWVDSTLGQGSTFSFTLPARLRYSSSQAESTEKEVANYLSTSTSQKTLLSLPLLTGNKQGKKIIIADDNHTNLKVLLEILQMEDYYLIAVDNGWDVLTQLEEHADIDLILLDIMMPELSGYEVCQKIRENHSLTDLPVLMLTAAILPEDMVAAFQSGANDFLHKPFDLKELKTRVGNLLLLKESAQVAVGMEVAFLQAQIKPHFLYNVLNSILSLSYLDITKTRTMIMNFATFLRGSFDFSNTNQLVPLNQELKLVQAYVEIEKMRFPDQFQFQIDLDPNLHCLIPPLILQPLVENAIRHGLGKIDQGGRVLLKGRRHEQEVIFEIIDNGMGMPQEQIEQIQTYRESKLGSVGLLNISKRIKQYARASLKISSAEQKGTTVTITLPYYESMKNLSHHSLRNEGSYAESSINR